MARARCFLLMLLLCFPFGSQAAAGVSDVAGSDPGLFMVMLVLALAFAAALTVIVLLSLLFVLLLAVLAGCGILSVSVFVGWRQRSLPAGLQWFFRLGFLAAGCGVGWLFISLAALYQGGNFPYLRWLLVALIGGAIAGWLGYKMAKMLLRILLQRLGRG